MCFLTDTRAAVTLTKTQSFSKSEQNIKPPNVTFLILGDFFSQTKCVSHGKLQCQYSGDVIRITSALILQSQAGERNPGRPEGTGWEERTEEKRRRERQDREKPRLTQQRWRSKGRRCVSY